MSRIARACALAAALGALAAPWALAAPAAAAAPAHRFAAPELAAGTPSFGAGGLGEVTIALAVVLAAIFALAWLVRRVRGVAGAASALGVLAEVRLGPKERAVLVRVGAQQLLLGVAPGQVSTLHVLAQPVQVERGIPPAAGPKGDSTAERPTLRAALLKSIGKS